MQQKRFLLLTAVVAALVLIAWAADRNLRTQEQSATLMERSEGSPKAVQKKGGSNAKGGAIAVESATARTASVTTDIRGIGSLRSDESVQITPEIAGRAAEFNFKEGDTVEANDILMKLDDALALAELADAQARFDLAQSNNERAQQLSRTGNVTEKAIDEATANFEIARSALELQRTRLSKHTIRAPFSGRVGFRKVSPGAYIPVGTPVVNLEKIDVLKVDFKLPEIFLRTINVGQTVDVTVDAFPNQTFVGQIYAIDPLVDANGRALQIRAVIPNEKLTLRPGLFARIVVKGQKTRDVVLVPEAAIVPRGGENFVYRIESGKALETKVKLGERNGPEVEIEEGLLPGAQVVTAGQLKLRNGSPVEIVGGSLSPGVGRIGG